MSGEPPKPPGLPHWTQLLGVNLRWVLALAGVAGMLVLGYWLGYPRFITWQERHLIGQARDFLKRSDWNSAALTARRVLSLNQRNLDATRIMADLAEKMGSPTALIWRGRLAELEPGTANEIALAGVALRAGELLGASAALGRVAAADRKGIPFCQAAARLALAENNFSAADRFLGEIVRQQPTDQNQLNLATLRLNSVRTNQVIEALAILERLRAVPEFRLPVVHALLDHALRNRDSARAATLARDLVAQPLATFEDHMAWLNVLHSVSDPAWKTGLTRLQAMARDTPDRVFDLVLWMNARGLAASARDWISSLPPDLKKNPPVALALAEACLYLKEWGRLEKDLAAGPWNELEFLRLALNARVMRETGRTALFRQEWRMATDLCLRDSQATAMLSRMTERWGWTVETEELWWGLALGGRGQRPALEKLLQAYTARQDSRQLLRVYRRILELNPADGAARNNVAMLSLLLRSDLPEAHDLARANYGKATNNLAFASTYAYSLYVQGQTNQALGLMRGFPEKALSDPGFAAYYGVLLLGAGDRSNAVRYLDLAYQNPKKLLAEELAMVAEARQKLKRP